MLIHANTADPWMGKSQSRMGFSIAMFDHHETRYMCNTSYLHLNMCSVSRYTLYTLYKRIGHVKTVSESKITRQFYAMNT